MRFSVKSLSVAAIVAGVAIACGSSDSSTFTDGGDGGAGPGDPGGGVFVAEDAGGTTPTGCKKLTCDDVKATCGPIGDGCGGVVECGPCDAAKGESCGGGGTPSVCGKPGCKPKTCLEIGANCGAAVDGCGGILPDCGTCDVAGEFCGGGGGNKCGLGVGEADGGASDGGNTCVPKSCFDLGVNCGPAADGCGGIIASCGTCNAAAGETCGGGSVPSVCGKACVAKVACDPGLNCGPVADGCGGIISCGGACPNGQSCGGGGQSNVCGGGGGGACTGLCTQQTACPNGGTTSISGTVTTPNGVLPIYGALVYVPNGAVQPFTTGVSCEQCGAAASGNPLVSTTTGPDGKFLLPNVPVSSNAVGKVMDIPVVIQLGRWRKQFTIQTTACGNTIAPAAATALPKNKSQGDIPLTAISTGRVDALECVFKKIGIDVAEFTDPSGDGRIRFYKDNGAVISAQAGACSVSGESCTNYGNACGDTCSINGASCTNPGQSCGGRCENSPDRACNNIGSNCTGGNGNRGKCLAAGTCSNRGTCNQTAGTPPASTLYNSPTELAKYDMTLFECVGGQQDKSTAQQKNVRDYANQGGRVYATHYSYVWLYNNGAAPWNATASWNVEQDRWASVTANLDTSFAKGQAFAQWLNIVGGLLTPLPNSAPPWVNPAPQITIDEARHDVDMPVASGAQRWLYTSANAPKESLQHYTFNTDLTKPAAQQCGRVLFSDFHVTTNSTTTDKVFPTYCDNNPLTAQEKVLAFMLFDLASCVSSVPPQAPQCTPKTCVQQGIECGQAGDGCGNVIQCPNCPGGQTCGGGGVASKCGAPTCVKKQCAANQCGTIADGCGGTVNCGNCANGTCGGGGANVCGGGQCVAQQCPVAAAGSACGPVANGCGQVLTCACPANTPCVNGTCGAPACVKRTCVQAGANCGQIADGCGGLLDCSTCLAPQTCGGGGIANVCGGGVN
jgi:hypothetical protein